MSWRHKSYDEVPALAVRGPELRTALRTVTAAWMFGTVWMVCVTGSRVTLFCRALGFTDFDFGLLAGLPFLATLGNLIAALLIERTGLTKHQFLDFATVSRVLYAVVALIPLVAMLAWVPSLPARWAVWTMQAVMLASAFLAALSVPAWWTWMGDLIPRRIRGRYFAHRSRLSLLVNIPVAIVLAVALDSLTRFGSDGQKLPMTMEHQPLLFWCVCGIFVFSAVMGTLDILLFRRLREIVPSSRESDAEVPGTLPSRTGKLSLGGSIAQMAQYIVLPMRDRSFRYYVTYGMIITFAAMLGSQFMWLDVLERLKFSQTGTDGLFMILAPVVGLIGCKGWGRLIDRWGRRPVLIFGGCLTVLSVMPYFLASPLTPNPSFVAGAINAVAAWVHGVTGWGSETWLSPEAPVGAWLIMSTSMLMGGTGWMGVQLAQNSIILSFADGRGRSRFIATHAVLISVGGLAGSLLGGYLAWAFEWLKTSPIVMGPFVWNNYHVTFLMSLLARMGAVAMAVAMPEPGSAGVTHIMRYVTTGIYSNLVSRLFYPLRILGWRGSADSGGQSPPGGPPELGGS
ncbi:MAG: MFS transporter [Planctomycetaceae bacterium]|nr:MFS transporter [Planctomycetaceae bacterium]